MAVDLVMPTATLHSVQLPEVQKKLSERINQGVWSTSSFASTEHYSIIFQSPHSPSQKTSMENRSEENEFIFIGLTDVPEFQVPLFIMFTLMYLITLVGNLGIILLISWDSHRHTSVYFFLSNLSLVDFGCSTSVSPKVLGGLLTGNKVISHNGCATQLFFSGAFAGTENFLLASMAYDRHAAICKPLHYTTTMTSTQCTFLASSAHISGFLVASILIGNTFNLSFCRSNVIHHFFCEIPSLLVLSCSDIHISESVLFIFGSFTVFFPFLVTSATYLLIFITILKIHSAKGHQKAFTTCASHLTSVSTFYETLIFIYFQPSSSHSMDTDKVVSVFYTMVTPMLNPLVYSFRNKEVKNAFRKAMRGQ
ncbi:olfactory receptor 5B2-like [Vombatus ursinus]|uniref:olfactory receptor 5B2-like n=1 Tax=Vombatus ursinus TaxID=29139 RepID=UPI000FFD3E1D|nr:olfactory receptor 5B2-like [Vombatus ursinus]